MRQDKAGKTIIQFCRDLVEATAAAINKQESNGERKAILTSSSGLADV